ncbi:replication initiator protein A [Staphylococcus chromogenes]|uniref:replication initiator protein A n=1 Tax=Staphylococcus chromogenes TaxID=46126 RepID=UPI002886FFAC|nr:replication initiator protein A [Staphylococcus chromogenes]MDT0656353.1 replication initiator protein A [Staphylococcus chromogenes]MDT0672743.1 replication initiator protein A [Staphylococcus chromogenes]MDT0674941.1 replication initiator protein A [Staphylococcus chromogenes]MDT0699113.1 replication initiator protein A [Staphylococcus chromogenes]
MSEQRFNIQQQYRQKFYQLPKVFFTNDKYIKLSNDAKIAYALLKDRLDLSIKNNWFDENGDIFFIYTNEKLKTILNCQNAKLVKIKKELTEVNLLEQIRCGQGKPNKLYLMNPEITKEDIYEIEKQEENVDEPCHDDEVRKSNFKKFENQTSRSSKIKLQEVRKSNTNDTDISNTDINDTELNDTTTTKTETNSSGSREKYLTTLLKDELSIKPTKAFIEKIAGLSKNMDTELLEYAIKYASENGNNPKQYLAKILEVWSKNSIFNLEQAQNFSVKSNINSLKSKEKTPRWITHPEEFKLKEENDLELAAEAQAFKEHLIRKKRYFK